MQLIEDATIVYETPDGNETVEATEVVFDEETGHWQRRPESGVVISIPRERVYRVTGTRRTSPEREDRPDGPVSGPATERETDEYGHPL